MVGQLIFSVSSGINFSVDSNKLADGSVIKFGSGFEDVVMTADGISLTPASEKTLEKKPVIEFSRKVDDKKSTFSSEKKRVIAEPTSRPVEVKRSKQPVLEPLMAPSTFEVGSSSGVGHLTKTQKKNRNRRLRKKISKQNELLLGAEDDSALLYTSPLLKGSRFYPLSTAQGEENVLRIASTLPRPSLKINNFENKNKISQKEKIKRIFQQTAEASGCSKEDILRIIKGKFSKNLEKEILKERTAKGSQKKNYQNFYSQPWMPSGYYYPEVDRPRYDPIISFGKNKFNPVYRRVSSTVNPPTSQIPSSAPSPTIKGTTSLRLSPDDKRVQMKSKIEIPEQEIVQKKKLKEYTPGEPWDEDSIDSPREKIAEELLEEIKARIGEEEEQEKEKEAEGDLDFSQDDLFDDEMAEAHIFMVETRSSSQKESEKVDEGTSKEDQSSGLTQQLLLQIKNKEEQI